jgi:cytochrome c oxidase assembly protein subunit 15
MNFSKKYISINWLTLIFIYLVVIAGSFVRITGSGMGCPDWPKCFGQWVPPTTDQYLPTDYKDIYSQKREKKIIKFAKFLNVLGLKKESKQLLEDKSLLVEQAFNVKKTWTEYINRLFGVLAGFGVLFVFAGSVLFYRKRNLVILSSLNLFLLIVQAWFGSIVVATNLVPWTITVHLLLALVIILIQFLIIRIVSNKAKIKLKLNSSMRYLIWISFVITFIQMFLGTQVREYIDQLTIQGFGRETWTEKLGISFFIHRSFSWLVLIFLVIITWLNYKGTRSKLIFLSFLVLALELISGVLLAYAEMPGLVQTSHLLFACILLGTLFYTILKMEKLKVH